MIRIAILALCGVTASAQDQFPQFEKRIHKDGAKSLPHRLLVPKAYKPSSPCGCTAPARPAPTTSPRSALDRRG